MSTVFFTLSLPCHYFVTATTRTAVRLQQKGDKVTNGLGEGSFFEGYKMRYTQKIRPAGFVVSLDGDGFLVSPSEQLTNEQREYLRANRDLIIGELEDFEERAAIMEFDAGLSRDESERLAIFGG